MTFQRRPTKPQRDRKEVMKSFASLGYHYFQVYRNVWIWPLGKPEKERMFRSVAEAMAELGVK